MSDIIQLLPDHVANQIAAGEVVQRPSSVVKELLENSIDAGATDIQLIIKEAGKLLIQVIDNGVGMSTTDARLCFERHATSKIKSADDLFALHTKGFRGEALASIAAIAQVELKTKQEEEELGNLLKIEGSKVSSQDFTTSPKGTSIAVKNLFYNIPARRNFLKSNTVETRHIVDEFQRVVLAHPEIAFSMYHNDSEIYRLSKSNLRKRIVSVFGSKMNEKLVPINEETDLIQIKGFVVKPSFAKKRKGEQFFFVNNRFVKSSYLHHAILSSFDGLLEQGCHPSYFLYLEVPTNSIDINIHPTKTEVKFDDEKSLYAILRATVKHSLGQYNVSPVLDFNRDASLDTPYDYKGKTVSTPRITVDPDFNPFQNNNTRQTKSSYDSKSVQWETLYTSTEDKNSENELFISSSETETGKTLQIQRKYVMSSIKSGVVLIHQNLAHQRILYEEFLQSLTMEEANSQQLLFPVKISLHDEDIRIIKSVKADLESAGFTFEKIKEGSISVKGIPTSIREKDVSIVIEKLIEDVRLEVPEASFSHFDIMAKSFASSLAIKTGALLSNKEQESLVNSLFSCKEPDRAPNGKAIFKTLTAEQLDKIFKS